MKTSIRDMFETARENAAVEVRQAFITLHRHLFGLEFERNVREDEVLAVLRSVDDFDGTHLRQAVALALADVDDASLAQFLADYTNEGMRRARERKEADS